MVACNGSSERRSPVALLSSILPPKARFVGSRSYKTHTRQKGVSPRPACDNPGLELWVQGRCLAVLVRDEMAGADGEGKGREGKERTGRVGCLASTSNKT